MKEIERYHPIDDGDAMTPGQNGAWCLWSDVKKLLQQLPEGMEHCSFELLRCEQGHSRIHATNWLDHGCSTCAEQKLKDELQEMTAKALAAVWLVPNDETIQTLRSLREEAGEIFLGKDKQTIAKLQDELYNAREALLRSIRPTLQGIIGVHGFKSSDPVPTRYELIVTAIHRHSNGGLEVEVQLP